ncbi:hypothetical protein VTO42DRAFT_4185 [Malbranchea cinnamomea]
MAAPTAVFSYAQAAKGLAPGAQAQQTKPATSSVDQKKAAPTSNAAEARNSQSSTETEVATTNGATQAVSKPQEQTEVDVKKAASGTSTPGYTITSSATLPKEDDASFVPNGTSDSTWDKQSQVSSSVDRSSQATEVSKDKPAESGWEKAPAPPKELKAAPIPAVNVWQQRREAQEAKAKALAASRLAAAPASKASTTKSAGTNAQGGAKKKPGDGGKNKDDVVPIAPVNDAASWPTPQSAQGESQKKAQEKPQQAEKSDKERPPRAHGKEKWMPVPYVPTAVFNTPLPPAARRGGRAGRAGRENLSHASGHNAGDKSSGGSSTVTGSKKPSQDRGHNDREHAKGTQDSSAHTADNGALSEQRKNAQASHSEDGHKEPRYGKNKERHPHRSSPEDSRQPQPETSENSFQARQDSKSFSKDFSNMRHHGDHSHVRYGANHERHFENGARSADFYKDPSNFQRNDAHRERGEHRSERGRGGYRGRGGHSNYSGPQNPPYHSAPLNQHPFQPSKNFTLSNDRHRPHHSNSNARVNLRSPSMPSPGMYGAGPYPIQTDLSAMYGYPPMGPGPMTAIPYQPYMEQFSLMSMISMQMEYYFSVDNLCKDLFLRKHMDSQGFVPLSVIANFKRIKSLTEDMDLLRMVCRQLKNVEYRACEDGVDRVRKRDKWEQWVLSMELRDPSAQNDGPAPLSSTPEGNKDGSSNVVQTDGSVPYTNGATHDTPAPSAASQVAPTDATNVDAPSRPAKLSSAAPEFMPMVPPATQKENANVRKTVDESSFPDEQIENLVIVVRKPGVSSPTTQSPLLIPSFRSVSSGFVDGYQAAGGTVTPERRISHSSREAQSFSEKSNVQPTTNLTSAPSVRSSESPTSHASTFWLKCNDKPIESLSTDLVHESYNAFRTKTLEKRLSTPATERLLDMDVLYQFWSHFLVRNFNSKMYNEFKSLAFDDLSSRKSDIGLKHLIKFYDAALSTSSLVISDEVARDVVDLARSELNEKEKPVFRRLRSAWRNGAFNLRSRKKIDGIIDDRLRTELEK